MHFEFSITEVELLNEILKTSRDALLFEINHTDSREFKQELRVRERLLEQVMSKLEQRALLQQS